MSAAQPKPPDLTTSDARHYRTAIKAGAFAGVNFGGRYTIVGWGCGSACLYWAMIDRATGRVHFDPEYRIVSTTNVIDEPPPYGRGLDRTFDGLRFRRDSTLLVVQGALRADASKEGLTFLHWSGARFVQVGFIPARELCRTDKYRR